MKILEETIGSLILPKNVKYIRAKEQLKTGFPKVSIFDLKFSKSKRIQSKIRKLNKLQHLSPRPLSKKLEICFSLRKKYRHNNKRSNGKIMKSEETLQDLMTFLLQKFKDAQESNMSKMSDSDNVPAEMRNSLESEEGEKINNEVSYVCVVDESNPIKINLRREKSKSNSQNSDFEEGEHDNNKKNKYLLYLKRNKEAGENCKKKQNIAGEFKSFLSNAETWDSNDGTFATAGEGPSAENTRSELYSTAKDFSETEDTLTRELKERLRKRKKAAAESGEPSRKLARYCNENSVEDGEATTDISISSDQPGPVSPVVENLNESIPQFKPYSESSNPNFQSTPLKQNPFSSMVNNADVVVEGDFDDELMKTMEKNWKTRFSETDIMEEEQDGSVPVQEVVEKLLNKPDRLDKTAIVQMKKGICYNFLQNIPCNNNPCKYEHIARTLFRKKLKYVPTSFIVQMIIAMKDDRFFVDALSEGFDILKSRPNSVRFLPFLCFLAFYVNDPGDVTFIPFWFDAAKYFTNSLEGSNIMDGFAHLLKIFRQIDQDNQPKIMRFLRLLRNPALNVDLNWKLLEPVISLKVPPSFLIEAVESCIKTKNHVQEVHDQIISRILVKNLSVQGVEVLLLFCELLKAGGELDKAVVLKRRLRSKVQSLEFALDKNQYPHTYFYFHEMKLSESEEDQIDEEEEERKVEIVLKKDEEDLQERGFSPPPNCRLNPAFFMTHKTLPRNWDKRPRPVQSALKRNKKAISKKVIHFDQIIAEIVSQLRAFEFTTAGRAFNYVHINNTSEAADKIVQTILQMSIETDEVVLLFEKVVLNSNTKNSSVIIASVALTMIVFFIRIPDWTTAYNIFKICDDQEIGLNTGEIFSTTETEKQILNTQCRKNLLLFEICINNGKLEDAYRLMEKFNLFSSDLSSDSNESNLRLNLVQEFFNKIIDCELTELLYNTFNKIWQAQCSIDKGINLREYANEFLILLFNDNKIAASNYYKNLLPYNCLKETTIRTIVVELVELSRVQEAESLMLSHFQTIYKLPIINGEPMSLTLPTYWTKEEIFLVLDLFLDKLTRYFNSNDVKTDTIFKVQIFFHEIDKRTLSKEVRTIPKCLNEDDTSLSGAKKKLNEVLNNEAFLFLTVYGGSENQLIIEPFSLMKNLERRSHI